MGADFYFYTTPYEGTPLDALNELRTRVFTKGEFRGAHLKPSSPDEAIEMNEPEGTASILDISKIGERPDFFTASPLSAQEIRDSFGSTKPTLENIEREHGSIVDSIGRGTARYLVAYDDDGTPSQYVFMGYSFD